MTDLLTLKPTLIETDDGEWLAVASPDSTVRLGALEPTKTAAEQAFRAALRRLNEALANSPSLDGT